MSTPTSPHWPRPRHLTGHTHITSLLFNLSFLSSSTVEEDSLASPRRRCGVSLFPAAAATHGGAAEAVGQRPAFSGGERGLHHPGVRKAPTSFTPLMFSLDDQHLTALCSSHHPPLTALCSSHLLPLTPPIAPPLTLLFAPPIFLL